MKFEKTVILKNGAQLTIRSGKASDAEAVLQNFLATHGETDFLLSYPDEYTMTAEQEAAYLAEKAENPREVELLAFVDGQLAGTAGIEAIGSREKVRHRADVGISVLERFWGLGIGKCLMESCISCARQAGFTQLELTVVGENQRAIALYSRLGFREYGRNPKGFRSRFTGYQEIVSMALEL